MARHTKEQEVVRRVISHTSILDIGIIRDRRITRMNDLQFKGRHERFFIRLGRCQYNLALRPMSRCKHPYR